MYKRQVSNCREIFIGKDATSFEDQIYQVGYYDKHANHYTAEYDLNNISVCKIGSDTKVLNSRMLSIDIPSIHTAEWVLRAEELPFQEMSEDFWATL